MSLRWLCVDALLVLSVAITAISCIGLAVARDPIDRIHFIGPPASVASYLLCGAVFLGESEWQAGAKVLACALLLTAMNAVVTHATALAARVRAKGHWELWTEERESVAETTPEAKR